MFTAGIVIEAGNVLTGPMTVEILTTALVPFSINGSGSTLDFDGTPPPIPIVVNGTLEENARYEFQLQYGSRYVDVIIHVRCGGKSSAISICTHRHSTVRVGWGETKGAEAPCFYFRGS